MWATDQIKDFREMKVFQGRYVFDRLIFASWVAFYRHNWRDKGCGFLPGYDTKLIHYQPGLEGSLGL